MIEMDLFFSNSYKKPGDTSFTNQVKIKGDAELFQRWVRKNDYAFALYKSGKTAKGTVDIKCHRSNKDFLWCNTLYADIDNDSLIYTIEDFERDFAKYEYYIQTSKSHQLQKNKRDGQVLPVADRFHIVFPIEKRIVDTSMLKHYLKLLHMMGFNGQTIDKNCIDSARFFEGHKESLVTYHEGESILVDIKLFEKTLPITTDIKMKDLKVPKVNSGLKNIILVHLKKAADKGEFDDYNDWIGVGFSMKKLGFTLEEYQYISKPESQEEAKNKWNSVKLDEIEASPLHLLSYARRYGSAAKW